MYCANLAIIADAVAGVIVLVISLSFLSYIKLLAYRCSADHGWGPF